MNRGAILTIACLALVGAAPAQNSRDRDRDTRNTYMDTIPAGARIPVRIDQTIDVRVPSDGRVFTGRVAEDVRAPRGNVMIPRGARAELIVQNWREMKVPWTWNPSHSTERRYMVDAKSTMFPGAPESVRTSVRLVRGRRRGFRDAAWRTGRRRQRSRDRRLSRRSRRSGRANSHEGHAVKCPAETVLTFRLEEPLRLAVDPYTQDRGYDEDGNHYHNGYYRRNDRQ